MKAEAFASAHAMIRDAVAVPAGAAMKAEAFASAHTPRMGPRHRNRTGAAMKAEAFASAHWTKRSSMPCGTIAVPQ